ncbi:MAG: RDD family protein, partial [Puniceicoccales bacterium]
AENRFNSLREHPHIEALLRQRVNPELAQLAFQSLLRREELEPRARVKLFGELAKQFRNVAKMPEDIGFGLSDEQLVRNCVESIYRKESTVAARPVLDSTAATAGSF